MNTPPEDALQGAMAQSVRDVPLLPDSLAMAERKEGYGDEDRLNSAAHRQMRWGAFASLGALCILYLSMLLVVLYALLMRGSIAHALPSGNIHMLILMGIALVLFAIVPLSLAMALVKMISASDEKNAIKLPSIELVKIVTDIGKSLK